MSELSESLHFWRVSAPKVRQMVEAVGAPGWIIAESERWTSFVSLEEHEHEQLAETVSAITLHWAYAEDFCLVLTVREGDTLLGECELAWSKVPGETAPVPMRSEQLDRLVEMGIFVDDPAQLETLASAVIAGEARPEQLRDLAAQLLGLPAYEWLSPSYCADLGLAKLRERYPTADEIESA